MKFTLSWLKDHFETNASLEDILYALTDLGLEVEGVENPAEKLAPFTIAKVLHAEKHPDADKLRVCRVLTDEGEKQIVCGAPNAREGITVVLCKPGDYVVFRAEMDAIVVFSACPQDMLPINNGVTTEAHFEVLDQ